jgi:hypothetical protein
VLDQFVAWLDAFREAMESVDAESPSGQPAGAPADGG